MEPRKIVIIKSSPRIQGNSNVLADRVEAGAREAGAFVTTLSLHGMNLHPCNACDACLTYDEVHCDTEDDMQQIYPALLKADAIVLASPIYCFTLSAQLKLMIDRLYAFEGQKPHPLKGKQIALLFTYGDEDPESSGVLNAIHTLQDEFAYTGSPIVEIIHATADKPGDIKKKPGELEKAFQLGLKLGQLK